MDIPKRLRVVSATRGQFHQTALGRSLALLQIPQVELRLYPDNSMGLPTLYNRAIAESAADPAILMFVHDDVHLCDFFWIDRIVAALRLFDIVGVAGNKRRVPNQANWPDTKSGAQKDLSGIVGYGNGFPPISLSAYGEPLQEVKLLDGLLLACVSTTLIASGIRFDEQFAFHFYDLDFCRQAEVKGLRMGTCDLSVVHESSGDYGGREWSVAYNQYLRKWGS